MNKTKISWLTVLFALALIASLCYCYHSEVRLQELAATNASLNDTSQKLQNENQHLQQELTDCAVEKEEAPVVKNGKYTQEQMDEIDRRLQRSLSKPYKN